MPAVPIAARRKSTPQRFSAGPVPYETWPRTFANIATAIANATRLRKKLFWKAETGPP